MTPEEKKLYGIKHKILHDLIHKPLTKEQWLKIRGVIDK